MKKTIRQIARFTAFLAAGLGLLYLAFRGMDFSEMKGLFAETKYGWIGLSLVFGIISHLSRSRRWVLLIEPLGKKPSYLNTFSAVMFGYLANYALPRAGEISRCVALGKKEKIPMDSLLGTVIVERAIDLLSLIVIMIVLLIARFEKFGEFFNTYIFSSLKDKITGTFGGTFVFWLLIGGVLFLFAALIWIFRQKIFGSRFGQKIKTMLSGIASGLKSVFKMQRKAEFLLHTLLIWSSYALMTWVVVFSMPGITDNLAFADGIFLLVIGSFGMVVPVQAGIGAFHWIVSRGLHVVYDLDLTEGLVFATLQHTSQTLMILILGGLSLIVLFAKKQKGSENKVNVEPA